VTSTDGAPDSAVHGGPGAEEPQVRLSPARARSGPGAGRQPARSALPAVTGSVRSAVEVARQRWGTPVGDAATPGRDAEDPRGREVPRVAGDPLRCFRIWSERPPAMADIWADLVGGGHRVAELGWGWLVPYWGFGLAGFLVACAARFVQDAAARPGRFAALLAGTGLLVAGLVVAGVI
jgi:hypothetical protein